MTQEKRTIRVDVDTQHGFCDPRGGLYVKDAEVAIAQVTRLNRDAARRGIPLVGSLDSHDFSSREFVTNGGPWPVHCVKGTWDWLKPAELLPARFRVIGRDATDVHLAWEDGAVALYFEKDMYSLFDNGNVERLLFGLAPGVRFEVYGIATDYCVKAAALELRKRGYETWLVTDAIAGVAPETTEKALAEMKTAGVKLTTTEAALARSAETPATAGANA
jgi:nicotinamidase/pyrazinamidase